MNQDSLQPIDMVDQERIKLERKRQRNRIAASKCRQRKLQKISNLEIKVNDLDTKNKQLKNFRNQVQNIIKELNNVIYKHKEAGCDINDIKF